jgi:4-amino-4-deoxy-L-arabinose transferase-like glycosyltransferase
MRAQRSPGTASEIAGSTSAMPGFAPSMRVQPSPRERVGRVLDRIGLPHALVIAAVLRLSWLLACPNEPTSDQLVYHHAARDLARGLGFVDADGNPHGWWPVGYPAALVPSYWLLGPSPASGYWANVIFGLMLVAACHALTRQFFGDRAANLAALVVATYPTFVLLTTVTASEVIFMPLAVVGTLLLVHAVKASDWRARALVLCASAGVVIGMSAYVRAPGILLAAVYPAYALASGQRLPQIALQSLVVGAMAIVVLLPWGFRNHEHFGSFQLVSMNGGANLWMGNHEGGDGSYAPTPAGISALPIPERDLRLRTMAVDFIRESPARYALLCVKRTWMTLRSDTIAGEWNVPGIRARFGHAAVAPFKVLCTLAYLAGVGLLAFALVRRRRALGPADAALLVAVIVAAAPFVLIVGGNRYQMPIVPYLLIWAASAAAARAPAQA